MSTSEITIAVTSQHLDDFEKVVQASQALGLEVSEQLPGVGVIIGRIDVARVAELERLEGVAAVEVSRDYDLPPPESDVQ